MSDGLIPRAVKKGDPNTPGVAQCRRLTGVGSGPPRSSCAVSPVVLEDGVIHRPTRLSVGPAWLTTAVYLNVSGSKLARGRAVRKGAGGGVSLGTSQRPVHTPPQPWRGGCKQGGGAVHGSEPHWPLSLSPWGQCGQRWESIWNSALPWIQMGAGDRCSGETLPGTENDGHIPSWLRT